MSVFNDLKASLEEALAVEKGLKKACEIVERRR